MKKALFIILAAFLLMEGASLWTWHASREKEAVSQPEGERPGEISLLPEEGSKSAEVRRDESEAFPEPSVTEVNGRLERTIHVGVRQYAWDPSVIMANEGEFVRLIVHNADVKHGLVIPDLGVQSDIPPEGAVIEFLAKKKGRFEFFCSVWCGEGHMEMRGQLIIE